MLDKNLIVGVYNEPDHLIEGVKKLKKHGVEIFDCFTRSVMRWVAKYKSTNIFINYVMRNSSFFSVK